MGHMHPNTDYLQKSELLTAVFLKDGVAPMSVGSLLPLSLLSGPHHGEGPVQFLSLIVRNRNLPPC